MLFHLIFIIGFFPFAHGLSDAEESFLNDVSKYKNSVDDLCATNNCCTLSTNESCPINNFVKDNSTLVFTGGETRCIYSDSSPYAFQVILFYNTKF
jgi:peptidase E